MKLTASALVAAATAVACAKSQPPKETPAAEARMAAEPPAASAPVGSVLVAIPPVTTDNKNALVLVGDPTPNVNASSYFSGWPAINAIDGDLQTSWYSGRDDSAARGKTPFLELAFATPATVRRVTVLGNRDPMYLKGYTILSGKLELLDAGGSVLHSNTSEGTGNRRDFDFRMPEGVGNVKTVRFTSISDEGKENEYGDVAIAELQVE